MSLKNEQHIQEFINVVQTAARNHALFKFFLDDLLTPAEYRVLAARWQIVKSLKRGTSQHKIAKKLNVGVTTVSRGSRVLMNPNSGFNQLLHKHL